MLELWRDRAYSVQLPFQQTSVKLDLAGPGGRGTAKEFRPQMVLLVSRRGRLVEVGEINRHPLKFLIDTGAVVTSLKGDVLQILNFGPLKVVHVIVAELQADAILGMDFSLKHECKVDVSPQYNNLIANSHVMKLWHENTTAQCCKITIKEDVLIPPATEMLIPGVIHRRGCDSHVNLVQGSQRFVEKYGILLCHSVVDIHHGVMPLRLLNPFQENVQLYKSTVAGFTEPVEICMERLPSEKQHVYQTRKGFC